MSAKADIYLKENLRIRHQNRPGVVLVVNSQIFNLFGGLGGRVPLGGVFLPARLCRATARSAVQKQSRSDCSEIGCPRSAGIDRRHRPDLTSETFLVPLLVTKEERHAADAVRPRPKMPFVLRHSAPPSLHSTNVPCPSKNSTPCGPASTTGIPGSKAYSVPSGAAARTMPSVLREKYNTVL